MQREVEELISKVNSIVGDSGRVELVRVEGNSLTVRLVEGGSEQCERCVVGHDTVEMLIREGTSQHVPSITDIDVIRG